MLLQPLTLTLAYLAVAHPRELGRAAPTFSNSLVNLGKMEISFYLNGRESPKVEHTTQAPPYFVPKSEPIYEEPCPCSSLRNLKDSFSNPTGILNKLLMNNDLFSANKEPTSSTLCCESHEHIEEGTVVFEFPATNHKTVKPTPPKVNPMPFMPFIFENLALKNPMSPLKTKSIEILLFPKKIEGGIDFMKLQQKNREGTYKDIIKIVGDKDVKKSFASLPTPPPPIKNETMKGKNTEAEKEKVELNKNIDTANNVNVI